MKTAIYECLKEMLALAKTLRPRSIVIHRDGRTYYCEWKGFLDAIQQLKAESRLAEDTQVGIVEVHKQSALGTRLVAEKNDRLLGVVPEGQADDEQPDDDERQANRDSFLERFHIRRERLSSGASRESDA